MKKAYFLMISLLLSSSMATAAVGADLDRFLESIKPLPMDTQDTMILQLVETHKEQLSASEFLRLATGRTYDNATSILSLAVTRFEDPMSLEILLDGAFNMLWSKQSLLVEEAAFTSIQARASLAPLKFYTCFGLAEKFHYLSEIQKMLILCGTQSEVTQPELIRVIERSRKVFNGWTTESMQEPVEQILVDYVGRNLTTLTLPRCTELAVLARYQTVKEKILGHCQGLIGRKAQPPAPPAVTAAVPASIEAEKPRIEFKESRKAKKKPTKKKISRTKRKA